MRDEQYVDGSFFFVFTKSMFPAFYTVFFARVCFYAVPVRRQPPQHAIDMCRLHKPKLPFEVFRATNDPFATHLQSNTKLSLVFKDEPFHGCFIHRLFHFASPQAVQAKASPPSLPPSESIMRLGALGVATASRSTVSESFYAFCATQSAADSSPAAPGPRADGLSPSIVCKTAPALTPPLCGVCEQFSALQSGRRRY